MKKNIILCAYGTGIGGMEVLFSGFVKYLLSHDINVILITIDRKDNIYRKLLKDEWDKIVIVYRNPDNILYMSDSSRNKQRQNIQVQLKEFDLNEAYAICGFYMDLLILIDLLKEYNTKITLIWLHPLDCLPGDRYLAATAKRLGEDRFFSGAFVVFAIFRLFFVRFVWRYRYISYI